MFLATPLVASHSVKGTGAFSEAPVLFAFGAFGAETLAPSGGPGVFFRFCYSMWLFHLHSAVKIRPFFRFSPWQAPRPRHFAGYPFGASRKKASAIFYNTAKRTTKMKPSPPQYPQSWSLSAKRGKSLYFHYIAAIKQSHTMTGPKIETAYSNQSSGNIYRLYGRTIKKRLPLQRKAVFHPNALTRGIR